jgi:hypothetical protein
MHYLIQKATRQHIAVDDDMPCPVECVKVRADAEGYVRHSRGAPCPVLLDSMVDVAAIRENGIVQRIRSVASNIKWDRVTHYRPEGHEWRSSCRADKKHAAPAEPWPGSAGTETAAMLLSVLCAFALGALIGWGWM